MPLDALPAKYIALQEIIAYTCFFPSDSPEFYGRCDPFVDVTDREATWAGV